MDRSEAATAQESVHLRDEALTLLGRLPELPETLAAGLVGSVARGSAGPRSDVDVFVVVPEETGTREAPFTWWKTISRALRPLRRDVSVIVYTPGSIRAVSTWYVLRLASDAVFVHDKGGEIAALLRRVIEKARGAGFEERVSAGHPYWVYTGDASKGWKLELDE